MATRQNAGSIGEGAATGAPGNRKGPAATDSANATLASRNSIDRSRSHGICANTGAATAAASKEKWNGQRISPFWNDPKIFTIDEHGENEGIVHLTGQLVSRAAYARRGLCVTAVEERLEESTARFDASRTGQVLLWRSGLCGTAGDLSLDMAFRILSTIQVRTTLGCRPLSISTIIVADGAQPGAMAPKAQVDQRTRYTLDEVYG